MFAKIFNPSGDEGDQALVVLESNPQDDRPSVNLQFEVDPSDDCSSLIGVRFSFDDWDGAQGFFDSCPQETLVSAVLQARSELRS